MKNLVVLTGAGMSAESGISTFRDAGGLWEQYPVEQVATPEGYAANPELVINFYNDRREQLLKVKPNRGHILLAELEKHFNVTVITQNVDNLHERAGSRHVIHLHGELTKVTSSLQPNNPKCIKELKPEEFRVKMHRVVRRTRPDDRDGHRRSDESRHLRHHRHVAERLPRRRFAELCAGKDARLSD